ncbi:MAG: universal stress protein [Akkermansiaceae bacterium]|nr:universal stress protein [Akkermansiaceae bacterium]NNM30185.1 universal stress protein [Akkermansiaceae bacterium]
MNTLQKILVAIDFSETSANLLKHVARIAGWNDAEIHVIHVIPEGVLRHRAGTHRDENPGRLQEAAESTMTDCLAAAGLAGVPAAQIVVIGSPADCIVEEAARLGADLLVLSAHDKGKKRLGSVASQCVRRAGCKTLLVRDWQAGNFEHIAACIDFSALSESVLRNALRVARSDHATLELLHVIYPVDLDYYNYKADFGTKSQKEFRAATMEAVESSIETLKSTLADDLRGVDVRTTILESGSPAEAITDHVREKGHDLVVMGTTGRARAFGLHFGSNAEGLMHDASCSVLAVKPPAEE